MNEAAGDSTPTTVEEATAQYERVLAEYRSAMDQVEAGNRKPALMEKVTTLYQASLQAHEQLMRFYPDSQLSSPETASGPVPAASSAGGSEPTVSAGNAATVNITSPIGDGPAVTTVSSAGNGSTLGKRGGVKRFIPPKRDEQTTPLRKDLLTSRLSTGKPQISRERKIAGGLPDWDPLPPGELLEVAKRKHHD